MSGIGTEIRVSAMHPDRCPDCGSLSVDQGFAQTGCSQTVVDQSGGCLLLAGISVYTFVQIYHTSDGVLRWYIGLGIALGSIGMALLSAVFVRAYKDFYTNL